MDLPFEVARTLHPNEATRLRCHSHCHVAGSCIGLEASMLAKLRLFEKTEDGYTVSALGGEVSKQVLQTNSLVTPPILTEFGNAQK